MLNHQTIGLLMLAGSVGLATFVTLGLLFASRFSGKSATWYYNQGLDAYQSGHQAKAMACLLKAIQKNANFTDAHYNLGLLYLEGERLNEARLHFDHVLDERPNDSDTLYNLALLDYAEGNMEAVCGHLESVQALDGDGWYLNGLACEELGRDEEAITALNEASVLNPENASCWLLLGKIYDRNQQLDNAVESFRQALEVDPSSLEGNYDMSMSLAKMGNWPETLRYSRRAIEIDPHYAKAYNQLGLACYCTENYTEAIEHYHKAIEIDPDYANAYNNLGYAYQKAEQYEEAIGMFEAYLIREEKDGEHTAETKEIRAHVEMLKKKLLEA